MANLTRKCSLKKEHEICIVLCRPSRRKVPGRLPSKQPITALMKPLTQAHPHPLVAFVA